MVLMQRSSGCTFGMVHLIFKGNRLHLASGMFQVSKAAPVCAHLVQYAWYVGMLLHVHANGNGQKQICFSDITSIMPAQNR